MNAEKIIQKAEEKDLLKLGIIFSVGEFYVRKISVDKKDAYEVVKPCNNVHAITDSVYRDDSLAIARCEYLYKRTSEETKKVRA